MHRVQNCEPGKREKMNLCTARPSFGNFTDRSFLVMGAKCSDIIRQQLEDNKGFSRITNKENAIALLKMIESSSFHFERKKCTMSFGKHRNGSAMFTNPDT